MKKNKTLLFVLFFLLCFDYIKNEEELVSDDDSKFYEPRYKLPNDTAPYHKGMTFVSDRKKYLY